MPQSVQLHGKSLQLLVLLAMVPVACQRDRRAGSTAGQATTQPFVQSPGRPTPSDVRDGHDDPFLRRIDGHVVRVPSRDVVIIDLGVNDALTPGTTFEVYDSQAGVPPRRGEVDPDVPAGTATVEVIRVAPGYSECRVVRRAPDAAINMGDLILKRPPSSSPKPAPAPAPVEVR